MVLIFSFGMLSKHTEVHKFLFYFQLFLSQHVEHKTEPWRICMLQIPKYQSSIDGTKRKFWEIFRFHGAWKKSLDECFQSCWESSRGPRGVVVCAEMLLARRIIHWLRMLRVLHLASASFSPTVLPPSFSAWIVSCFFSFNFAFQCF